MDKDVSVKSNESSDDVSKNNNLMYICAYDNIPPYWKGSGPEPGILGINVNSYSNKAIKNYFPKEGGIRSIL